MHSALTPVDWLEHCNKQKMGNVKVTKSRDDAKWKIWHQDTFDREGSLQLEIEGEGLLAGLMELWTRHLFETVQGTGWQGFSHFSLWLDEQKTSIKIMGDWDGQVRLRSWAHTRSKDSIKTGLTEAADKELILKIAQVHKDQILRGETSEAILDMAKVSANCEDFENKLKRYME